MRFVVLSLLTALCVTATPHSRSRVLLVHGLAKGKQRRDAAVNLDWLVRVQFCRMCPDPGAEGSEVSGLVAAQV